MADSFHCLFFLSTRSGPHSLFMAGLEHVGERARDLAFPARVCCNNKLTLTLKQISKYLY
jgi:hypothetical protein